MKQISTYTILMLVFSMLLVACGQEDPPCPDTPVPNLRVLIASENNPDTLKVNTIGLSNTQAFSGDFPEFFYTPLNTEDTTTGFVLTFIASTGTTTSYSHDTVYVNYETKFQLDDLECGFDVAFTISSLMYTTSVIDTIKGIDPVVDSNKNYNVEISY